MTDIADVTLEEWFDQTADVIADLPARIDAELEALWAAPAHIAPKARTPKKPQHKPRTRRRLRIIANRARRREDQNAIAESLAEGTN